MEVGTLSLAGLQIICPKVHRDSRGFFVEAYNQERYQQLGLDCKFVQDNHSRSSYGTLRGLHFQTSPGQAKLLRVASGRIFDVAVDIRPYSPTFGQWEGVYLDAESHQQLFVPVGFAHGFCVVSDYADVLYKVSSVYSPTTESGCLWNDPEIDVQWPIKDPLVSERDRAAQTFAQLRRSLQ